MKKENKIRLYVGIGSLFAFILWTLLIGIIDVRAVGPLGSAVGFATVNTFFHGLFGVNMLLYTVTDWLGLVPIAVAFAFAMLGLVEWIKRKSILKVDLNIILLGVFYLIVIAVYILFESVVINYRPVLIEGYLESSYPSSTTLLVATVMPTAKIQLNARIKKKAFRKSISLIITLFTALMVFGRLISGVHWLSDIIGGLLFSIGLVEMYGAVFNSIK